MTPILTTRRPPRQAAGPFAIFTLAYVAALGFVFLPDGARSPAQPSGMQEP